MSKPQILDLTKYQGFEQGPIRPPSEANSLLVRVTRNCPWNRCMFCPVYKGRRFTLRPVSHVIEDIDSVFQSLELIHKHATVPEQISRQDIHNAARSVDADQRPAFNAAVNWMASGMKSIFLQDANSLVIKPDDLVKILKHLKYRFPWVERITSYARSKTIAKIKQQDLDRMMSAGLNRIHIGLESGSDRVLKMVKKGVTKAIHIQAGQKVKKAGMELSEYVMPGLGGEALSHEHALETADALNQIDPDFIRLRTLAIPGSVELAGELESGRFIKCSDVMMAKEILIFIKYLKGISSVVKSDHILNLFQEVEGKLPEDQAHMIQVIDRFLALPPQSQCLFQVGRRLGIFHHLADLDDPQMAAQAQQTCQQLGITPENVDNLIDDMMKRFI